MSQRSSARGRARIFGFVAVALTVLGVFAACSETPRANGEQCLKNNDCLSDLCIQQQCRATPTLLDAQTDGPGSDATAVTEGGSDSMAADTGKPPVDAGKDSPTADDGGDSGASSGGGDSSTTDGSGE